MKRSGSNNHQFNKRIPKELKAAALGRRLIITFGDCTRVIVIKPTMSAIRFSLGTSDPLEAKIRLAEASARVEEFFTTLRLKASLSKLEPVRLSQRQCAALSKELYEAWASDPDTGKTLSIEQDDQGQWVKVSPALDQVNDLGLGLEQFSEKLEAMLEVGDLETAKGEMRPIAQALLERQGIGAVDEESLDLLSLQCIKALSKGMAVQARKALKSDFSPDPYAQTFPALDLKPTAKASLKATLAAWEAEEAGSMTARTMQGFKTTLLKFAKQLGHDDITRVSALDVIAYKDMRVASGIAPKTINGSDLCALNVFFKWAVVQKTIADNPAKDVSVKKAKKIITREAYLSKAEAAVLLNASLATQRGARESFQRWAGRRWAPWLMAYSGARVGEILQLSKGNVLFEGGIPFIRLTPEDGTIKTGKFRDVPIHEHLIALGFLQFVEGAPEGKLFMGEGLRAAINRLREFARLYVKDKGVQPNHAWRYTFKTYGLEADISEHILDAICGHSPRTQGESYTKVTLKTRLKAMGKFPRYDLSYGQTPSTSTKTNTGD
jgi:integrase